jgi:hypothetical protein
MRVVPEHDPRQAVLEHLVRESDVPRPLRWFPGRVAPASLRQGVRLLRGALLRQPVPFVAAKGFNADPATVQFVKQREIPGRRLFAVSFKDRRGQSWAWLVAAEQDEAGEWSTHGVAGGGGDWSQPELRVRRGPWLNLGCSWGADGFYGGGAIHRAGADVGRVRLRFRDGSVLEDDSERGLALFATGRRIEIPVVVELLDRTGAVIASHTELES